MEKTRLDELREKIDRLDGTLVKTLDERFATALEIAEYKRRNNLPVINKQREREVADRVASQANPETADLMRILYGQIFSLTRAYEHRSGSACPLSQRIADTVEKNPKLFPDSARVACQGVEGAYSYRACERLFRYPDIIGCDTWDDVFARVSSGEADYGILPIENSTAGSVNRVYDLMRRHECFIARSIRVHIEHSLLAPQNVKLEDLKEIISHEQAISQCSDFLSRLEGVTVTVVKNTAAAAKLVASSGRNDVAAIASGDCAELYGLTELDSAIQNVGNNYTRFICISKNLQIFPGADRTSFVLTAAHRPGSLYSIISKLNAHGINMRKLESRPIPEKDFEFSFYFVVEASVYSRELYELFDELYAENVALSYLGSYSEVI